MTDGNSKKAVAAAHEAYAKTTGGLLDGKPMDNAIRAFLSVTALPDGMEERFPHSGMTTAEAVALIDSNTIAGLRIKLEAAEAQVQRLTEDNEALERHNQALLDKVSSEDCACAYDHPDDVCLGHSPKLKAAEARIKALEEALRPFADFGEYLELETEGFSNADELHLVVEDTGFRLEKFYVGAFRRARAALSGSKE